MTLNKFYIKDRVSLVTGGGGLLGLKHAEALAEIGSKVILLDIDYNKAAKNLKFLKNNYQNDFFALRADITKELDVMKATQKILKKFKKIDILINNASENPKLTSKSKKNEFNLENFSLKVWEKQINVGLTGAFICSKVIGKVMAKKKSGIIINISSDLGLIAPDQRVYEGLGFVKPITYSVVKHGIIGLTKYLSTYWANSGVRSNTLCPGGVFNNQPKSFVKKVEKLIPLNRMADSNEYKSAIQFLCSDASSYMNGATLVIDGGRVVW